MKKVQSIDDEIDQLELSILEVDEHSDLSLKGFTGLTDMLKKIASLLKAEGRNLYDHTSLLMSIMDSNLQEREKLEYLEVFIEAGLPHCLPVDNPNGVTFKYEKQMTLFHRVVSAGDLKIAQRLMDHGEPLDQVTKRGNNALISVAYMGNTKALDWLIGKGLRTLNVRELISMSLLSENEEMLQKALSLNVNDFSLVPDDKIDELHHPIHIAFEMQSSLHIIGTVIDKLGEAEGVFNVNEKTLNAKGTRLGFLHLLVESRHPAASSIALHFLDLGINPLDEDKTGRTAAAYARARRENDLAQTIEGWVLARREQAELKKIVKAANEKSSLDISESVESPSWPKARSL